VGEFHSVIDFGVEASRAVVPYFYRAPFPINDRRAPKEYQLAGIEYVLARSHALIGDAPGVGKTAQGIGISNAIDAKRTLVVCPASLRLNWEREIWMWSTITNVATYPVFKSSDGISPDAHYVIISYDLLRNSAILDALLDLRWDHMILDEAHYIKDPRGNARTRPLCAPDALPSVVGRITMLSGTILPNQPVEAYNAIRLLDWSAFDRASLEDFRETYYTFGEGFINTFDRATKTWKAKWSKKVRNTPVNLEDFQRRLRSRIMVRRLKEDVLHELPRKQWHPFPIRATAAMREALKHPGWLLAERLYEMDPDAFDRGIPVDGAVATARRLLGEAKAPAVADYIDDLIDGGVTKIVVAAWHLSVLADLRDRLSGHGLVYMDGGTSDQNKQKAVDQFQGDEHIKIILGQTRPIGQGWNLTAAQDVVLAEPDWVPGMNDQLLDRTHRLGQKGDYILGHIPVVPGTMDERVLATAIEKDANIHLALDHHV